MVVRSLLISGTFVAAAVLSGCARPHYYEWGSYNASVYRMFNEPENFVLDNELEQLAAEIEQGRQDRIPPGKAAHVGFLYATKGDRGNAKRYFEMEKRLFPESSALMTRLIHKAEGKIK